MTETPAHRKPADHAQRVQQWQCQGVYAYAPGGFIQVAFASDRGADLEIVCYVGDSTRGQFNTRVVFTSYQDFWASVV